MAHDELFAKLSRSRFRRSFALKDKDLVYIREKGLTEVLSHAYKIFRARLAPANPKNDGSQTPMRGHPVFIAQHATGTCCRSCLLKWHAIPKGRELTDDELKALTQILEQWFKKQCPEAEAHGRQLTLF
jgi:hypothetical protein